MNTSNWSSIFFTSVRPFTFKFLLLSGAIVLVVVDGGVVLCVLKS